MAVVVDKPVKRWTYEEYYRLEGDQRYEIIGGNLLMAPAPDTWHQNWVGSLFDILRSHARKHQSGRVFVSPIDVVLDEENTVQPDLVYISNERSGIIQRRAIFGVPDLLVELVSPSSVRRDRYDKKELYARFGVREYWIGDPANRSLEILTLQGGRYELHGAAEEKGRLNSLVVPGLEFDLAEVE
jgi:Uma2 family endonuclease